MTNNTAPALTDELRKLIELAAACLEHRVEMKQDSFDEPPYPATAWDQEADQLVYSLRALLTSPRAAVPHHVRVSLECTAQYLEYGNDPKAAAAEIRACLAKLDAAPAAPVAEAEPIPMLLFCPRCGTQHIDAPEFEPGRLISSGPNAGRAVAPKVTWSNPPHRSHLCHACGIVWRPADVATVGVEAIETSGKADTWTKEAPWIGHNQPAAQAVAADGEPLVRNLSALERVEEDIIVMTRMSNDTKRLPMEETESLARLLYYIEDLRRAAVSPATADIPDAVWDDAKRTYQATADTPLNGIAATIFHGEGAISRCSYCGRYSLDRKTLGDRPPKCECGEKHGWSGSFEKPGSESKWSGAAPVGMPTTADERPTQPASPADQAVYDAIAQNYQSGLAATADERATFEAWFARTWSKDTDSIHTADEVTAMREGEHYDSPVLSARWEGWQAARASQAAAPADPIKALIARHAEELDRNYYAYFELAYTHQTGWMAWITDKPFQGPVLNPDRKVLARGQGATPAEACRDALGTVQGAQGGKGGEA